MDTFKARLEKLISDKKLNANSFSAALGYEKSEKIYRLLRDEKNQPSMEILQDISNKFEDINVDWLLNGRGFPYKSETAGAMPQKPKAGPARSYEAVEPTYFLANEPGAIYERTRPHTPNIVTVNEHGIDNILYVPVKAQAGYLLGYGDKEYMETLPSFRMPGLNNNTFRMFEVEGLSMSPTLSNRDKVIGEWVPTLDQIRENRVHIMVLKDGVCIKRVLNRVKERNKLYLKSDTLTHRANYPIVEIEPSDVLEIWYVRLKVSGDLSEPSEVYTRIADLELNMFELLKRMGIKGE